MPKQLGRALLFAALSMAGASIPASLRARGLRRLTANAPQRVRAASSGEGQAASGAAAATATDHEGPVPPVLLATPAYLGTLAAVRALGRESISVTTVGPQAWTISGCSKYASTHVGCPPTTDTERFVEWLLEFGRCNERHVLLPTCDDTAWLYARHRELLARHFYMSSTEIGALHTLLHKGLLAISAREAGLDVPRSWSPRDQDDLRRIAGELTFPVLLKPTTQVLFNARSKGIRVERAAGLPSAWADLAGLRHCKELTDFDPSTARPLVQEFFPDAANSIYNISSYAQDGKLWGARAGRKILQRPRRLGVGVCFEEAPLDQGLVEKLERLVRLVGFDGVFEAEFIQADGRHILIDFNPRFYNQMGFDVARGLQLPTLAYFGALRQSPPAAAQSGPGQPSTGKVFAHGSVFKVMIASQRLSGALSSEETERWLAWYQSHQGQCVDAVKDPDDVWPARLDAVQMLGHYLRHPRHFVRTFALNR